MGRAARVGLLLLALASAGAAAWVLLGQDAGPQDLLDGSRDEPGTAGGPDASASGAAGGPALLPGEARPRPATPGGSPSGGPATPPCKPEEGVSGVVLDGRRTPIAEARVMLFPAARAWWPLPDRTPLAEGRSAADGTFLVGPAPAGPLRVRAEAKGMAPAIVVVPARGGRIEVILDAGGALAITVVDEAGARVPGATVQHIAQAWAVVAPVVEATTGEDGVARLADVGTGSAQVVVVKAGKGMVRLPEVSVAPGKLTEATVVLQGGFSITGRVLDGELQRPVPGAAVAIAYPFLAAISGAQAVRTDAEGRYTLPVIVPVGEQFELGVAHQDYASRTVWLNFNESRPRVMQHDIVLAKAMHPIVGRVQGRDGNSVAGATVTYGGAGPHMEAPRTTSDGEGRFELPPTPWQEAGRAWVVAVHPREGTGHATGALVAQREPRPKEVVLRLGGQGQVAGTVADASGQPVAGATVVLSPDWNAMRRATREGRDARRANQQDIQVLQEPLAQERLSAVSDATGAFLLEAVPQGVFLCAATWGALTGTSEASVSVLPGETARTRIVLSDGARISGMVRDEAGQPIAGAQVWGQAIPPQGSRSQAHARTQADGRFELRVSGQGTWELQAHAAGHAVAQQVRAEVGAQDVAISLRLLAWLEGEVLLDERPYAGTFHVSVARQATDKQPNEGMWNGDEGQTFNHPEGRFTCRGLDTGEYRIGATTSDGLVTAEDTVVRVTAGQAAGPVQLRLEPGATLRVLGETSSGAPLREAWVWAGPVAGQGRGAASGGATDERGEAFLRGLGSGTYRVTVNTNMGDSWTETVDLARGREATLRTVERVPGRVRVLVLDAAGSPVAKTRPVLLGDQGEVQPNWQRMQQEGLVDPRVQDAWQRVTVTDESGTLLRHHVPPGRYRLAIYLGGAELPSEPVTVEVAAGATSEVTVRLKGGG